MEHLVYDLHQLHFIEQAVGANHVGITLIELSVSTFLRTVGTPHGLNLIALKRHLQFLAVLHHETSKRHCQIVAKSFLTELSSQVSNVVFLQFSRSRFAHEIARIENFEEKFVALFAIFAHQRGKVLHGWRLNLTEAIQRIHIANRIKDIVALGHLNGREVARTFRNAWFCHKSKLFYGAKIV